jgi:hypothetical protein
MTDESMPAALRGSTDKARLLNRIAFVPYDLAGASMR